MAFSFFLGRKDSICCVVREICVCGVSVYAILGGRWGDLEVEHGSPRVFCSEVVRIIIDIVQRFSENVTECAKQGASEWLPVVPQRLIP
jgi:hypothetical protein